ncbi:MAG: spore coat protein CotJB [Clostridia bacterium]
MLLNNNCCNNNIDDCSYEPTGINAQFGYNTSDFNNCCNQMCCKQRDEIGEKMLSDIRCLKFAITDIGEYLNTHPDDQKALCLHREYSHQLRDLSDKYQRIYGPLSIYFPCNSWRWLEEPWPWEGSEV